MTDPADSRDGTRPLPPGVSPDAWPVYTEAPRPLGDDEPPMEALAAELRTSGGRMAAVALGRQVRAVRERRGLTQRQVAELLGWDQPQVARLEGGGVYPTLPTMLLLAERLAVRVVVTPGPAAPRVLLEEVQPAA